MPNVTPTKRLDDLEPRVLAVEQALGVAPKSTTLSRMDKFLDALSAHKIISIAGAVSAMVLTIVAPWMKGCFDDSLDNRIERVLDKKGGVYERLKTIDSTTAETNTTLKTLQPLIDDLIHQQLSATARLSPQSLSERLPALGNLADAARHQGVSTSPSTTQAIFRTFLQSNVGALGYWPTAAKLINFEHNEQLSPGLPDCADLQPSPAKLLDPVGPDSPKPATVHVSGTTFENCTFSLDSEKDDNRVNELLLNHTFQVAFKHCAIVYRGGRINLILLTNSSMKRSFLLGGEQPEWVSGTFSGPSLAFDHCLFDFYLPALPPANVQMITKSLLAQNGPTLALPGNSMGPHGL